MLTETDAPVTDEEIAQEEERQRQEARRVAIRRRQAELARAQRARERDDAIELIQTKCRREIEPLQSSEERARAGLIKDLAAQLRALEPIDQRNVLRNLEMFFAQAPLSVLQRNAFSALFSGWREARGRLAEHHGQEQRQIQAVQSKYAALDRIEED